MKPVLFLIRHGRTLLNEKNCFRGKADPTLAPEGIKDAEEALKLLLDMGIEPAFIVSSDKTRAKETAQIINKEYHIPEENTSNLRAWNLGYLSGQPKNEENLKDLEQYVQNPDIPVPEGESLNDFRDRTLPVLSEAFELATRVGVGIVVAHSSTIHECGSQLFGSHKRLLVKPGGIVAIGFGDNDITAERIFKPLDDVESAASVS